MWYVYIIQSKIADRKYIGITTNLEKRLSSHNRGTVKSTKAWAPWNLIYHEEFSSKEDAASRERFFKSGKGREFMEDKL